MEPEPEVEPEPEEDDDPVDPDEPDDPDEEFELALVAEPLFPTWPQAANSNTLAESAARKIGFDRAFKGRSPVSQFCGQVRELVCVPDFGSL